MSDKKTVASNPENSISHPQLIDLVHQMCLSLQDGDIQVNTERGCGTVVVRSGQIPHASFQNEEGTSAFVRLVQSNPTDLTIHPKSDITRVSIDKEWEELLITAVEEQKENGGVPEERIKGVSGEALYNKIAKMTIQEKIRLGLRGDRECRSILIRDGSRAVQLAVINNPLLTEQEVATFACSKNLDEAVLRKIANNREWLKYYPVRLALAKNPKTPLAVAMKLLSLLLHSDLKQLARSKDVSTAVANGARRMLLQKQDQM